MTDVGVNQSERVFTGFPPSGSTLCPRCDYDLQGLPIDHQCPECGLKYDLRSKLWREPQSKEAGRLRLGWFSAIAIVTIFGVLVHAAFTRTFEWLPMITMVTLLPTWIVFFITRRRVPRAAIVCDGIVYADTYRRPQLVRWSEIKFIYLHEYEIGRPLELRLVNNKSFWAEQLCKTCANVAELTNVIHNYSSNVTVRDSEWQ